MILAMAASLGLPASSIEVLTNTLTANSGVSAGIYTMYTLMTACTVCTYMYVQCCFMYIVFLYTQYWCIQVTGHITGWEVMNNSSD